MNTATIMIEEATKAKDGIVAELHAFIGTGKAANTEKLADLINSLEYYNRLLVKLGAGPKGE